MTDISADTRATIGRHSGDYRPTLDRHLSTPIGRQLLTAIGRHSCIGRALTDTIGRHSTDISADTQASIGRHSGDYRPTLDRHLSTPIARQLSTAIGRHSCIGRVSTGSIGRHSTDIWADTRATIGRHSCISRVSTDTIADTRPISRPTLGASIARHSGDYRPTLDRHLSTSIGRQLSTAIGRHSCIGRALTDTIGQHSTDISADTQASIGRHSGDYRPTLDRHLSAPIARQLSTAIGRHSCIGRVSTGSIGRHLTDISADTRATIGRHSGDYRPPLDRHLSTPIGRQLLIAIGRHSCIGRALTDTIGRHSTDISADTRATIGRHSTDICRHLSPDNCRQLSADTRVSVEYRPAVLADTRPISRPMLGRLSADTRVSVEH